MENSREIREILYPGKSVLVEIKNTQGNKILKRTTVHQLDAAGLVLNLPNQGNIFEHARWNTEIVITCKHNEEEPDYVFSTYLIRLSENPPVAILQAPAGFTKGRQAARSDVAVPFSYFINNQEIKDGMVRNLSMNGLLAAIKPNFKLNQGDHIAFKLFLPNAPDPLLLAGNIARITKRATEYQIALHFPSIPFQLQDKIVKFLFSNPKTFAPVGSGRKDDILKSSMSSNRKTG